jgi:iron complex outermembrane receptor protein
LELADSEAIITVGMKNVFDEKPPVVYDAANFSYDPKHHDPRGQMYYVRAKYRF